MNVEEEVGRFASSVNSVVGMTDDEKSSFIREVSRVDEGENTVEQFARDAKRAVDEASKHPQLLAPTLRVLSAIADDLF